MMMTVDAPAVEQVLRCLYKDAQRGSTVAQELMEGHNLTYPQAQELLSWLLEHRVIENIEKNKSNGEAVYKLTRHGEKMLEERIHSRYADHLPFQGNGRPADGRMEEGGT